MLNGNGCCPLTDKEIDSTCCNVMVDIASDLILPSCAPEGYTLKPDYKNICKNCEVNKLIEELNS